MATEDWSVYRRVSIIAINWIFFQNGFTKIYKLGLEMKRNYQGYIESENFGLFRMFRYKKFVYKNIFWILNWNPESWKGNSNPEKWIRNWRASGQCWTCFPDLALKALMDYGVSWGQSEPGGQSRSPDHWTVFVLDHYSGDLEWSDNHFLLSHGVKEKHNWWHFTIHVLACNPSTKNVDSF